MLIHPCSPHDDDDGVVYTRRTSWTGFSVTRIPRKYYPESILYLADDDVLPIPQGVLDMDDDDADIQHYSVVGKTSSTLKILHNPTSSI